MTEKHVPPNAGPVNWVGPADWGFDLAGLIHCIRLPQEASLSHPAPVVVMVHGFGGNESVMWIFKRTVPAGAAIITPRAPLEVEPGFAWFERQANLPDDTPNRLTDNMAKLKQFLDALPELYPIDPERLILVGFSQGAAVSNALVLSRANVAAGIASLAGFVPAVDPPLESLAGLPVFIGHGQRDDMVPLDAARHTRQVYESLQADITYNEYNVSHKMSQQAIADLKSWLHEHL